MVLLSLLACLFISSSASASLEQTYVKRLTQSRSASEIALLTSDFEELKISRTACNLQLRKGHAPLSCYESLEKEVRWGLHQTKSALKALRSRLDELCSEAASRLKVPRHNLKMASLSQKCRLEIAEARKIQNYRDHRPTVGL